MRSGRGQGWHRMVQQDGDRVLLLLTCSQCPSSLLNLTVSCSQTPSAFLLGSFQFCVRICGQIFVVVVADWKLISIITQAYVL